MKRYTAPGFLCALAAVLLGWALQRSSGMFEPWALALATLTAALAILAAIRGRLLEGKRVLGGLTQARVQPAALAAEPRPLVTQLLLGIGILSGLYCHLFESPTFYADPRRLGSFHPLALFALVIVSAYLCLHLRASLRRARFWLLLAVFALMGIAIIRASQEPHIDVWVFQQIGGDALWRGFNPYSISYPDLYARSGETLKMYGPAIVEAGRVTIYPYPPLTALLEAPVHAALGEVRYLLLFAMLLAAWAIARLAEPEGVTAELAALYLLFQPRAFFMLEQGWTDSMVLALFAVALLVAQRWRGRPRAFVAVGIAVGLLAASKQYTPLLIVPLALALPPGKRLRTALVALGVVLVTALPFALWDPAGLWRDVVMTQFRQPMRTDSLSLLALWVRQGGVAPGGALLAFLAAGLVLLVTLRRRLSLGQAATVAAASWLILVLLNKQAFCNYDYLGIGLLCAAVAARSGTRSLEAA